MITSSESSLSHAEYSQTIRGGRTHRVTRELGALLGFGRPHPETSSRFSSLYVGYYYQSPNKVLTVSRSSLSPFSDVRVSPGSEVLLASVRAYNEQLRAKQTGRRASSILLEPLVFTDLKSDYTIAAGAEYEPHSGTGIAKVSTYGLVVHAPTQADAVRLIAEKADPERAAAMIGVPTDQLYDALAVLDTASDPSNDPQLAAKIVFDGLKQLTQVRQA